MKAVKFLTLIVILGFGLIGCSGSVEDTRARMAQMQNMADVAERALTQYDERVGEAEAAIAQIQAVLADPNLPIPAREEMQVAIAKALAVKAKFEGAEAVAIEQIRAVRETIKQLEADGIQPGEDLIVFGERMQDVGFKLPSSVGPIIGLIGMIVAGFGEARARSSKKVARGVITSVGTVFESGTGVKDEWKRILKEEQRRLGIRASVKKLLDT